MCGIEPFNQFHNTVETIVPLVRYCCTVIIMFSHSDKLIDHIYRWEYVSISLMSRVDEASLVASEDNPVIALPIVEVQRHVQQRKHYNINEQTHTYHRPACSHLRQKLTHCILLEHSCQPTGEVTTTPNINTAAKDNIQQQRDSKRLG